MNGNDLKLKATNFGKKKITVQQTCEFDSIVQLLLVAYFERPSFKLKVIELSTSSNLLFKLVKNLAEKSITSNTYEKRAQILYTGSSKER